MKKLKIGLYSPYLDTLGGGEKYMLTIAEVLSKENSIDFFLGTHLQKANIDDIKDKAKLLHEIDLSDIKFIPGPFGKGSSFTKRLVFLMKYDYFFYLTDGSIFYSTAKNNIIHFQVPFENKTRSLWSQLKLTSWKSAIYNSKFTKSLIEKTWAINGSVIYPPVSVEKFKKQKKKKQILSVGRFFGYLKSKKQEVLIDAFKKMYKDEKKLADWSLHLAGGAGEGDSSYLEELKKRSKGFPIYLHPNIPYPDLVNLYEQSGIYWHASGFEESDPTKMEHFGITTVEAMAAGCVPVVIKKGGQVEIVEDGVSGLFWESKEELVNKTMILVEDPEKMVKLSDQAIEKSKYFSKENFKEHILKLIYD
jgi:glycosyltransferase involved in cell wall biosynthesis